MESAAQMQQQPEFTKEQKEMAIKYQQMEQERQTIVQKIIEIGEEKREHELVLETLSDLPDDKKAWRLINGVLVEKTCAEIRPDLKDTISNMESLWDQLEERSNTIKKELFEIEQEIGRSVKDTRTQQPSQVDDSKGSSGGVLV